MNKTVLLVAALLHGAAQAHITLEEPTALAGSGYKAVFRVSHGCDGSATHTIGVRIPPGFQGAKPMPKPGWVLSVKRAPLAQPYENHGRRVTDDVVEITWRASSPDHHLRDAHYDEFTLRGQTPKASGALWFKVLQVCEQGQTDWAEVPAEGTATRGLKAPAVLLDLQANPHAGHSH